MADVVWPDVVALDSSLSAVEPWAQTLFLDEANALNADAFDGANGPRFRLARVFLAAHRGRRLLDVANSGGAAGPVTSEDVGGMSTTYAAPAAGSTAGGDFELTAWGQQYAELCRSSPRARLGARR